MIEVLQLCIADPEDPHVRQIESHGGAGDCGVVEDLLQQPPVLLRMKPPRDPRRRLPAQEGRQPVQCILHRRPLRARRLHRCSHHPVAVGVHGGRRQDLRLLLIALVFQHLDHHSLLSSHAIPEGRAAVQKLRGPDNRPLAMDADHRDPQVLLPSRLRHAAPESMVGDGIIPGAHDHSLEDTALHHEQPLLPRSLRDQVLVLLQADPPRTWVVGEEVEERLEVCDVRRGVTEHLLAVETDDGGGER
mmetsp:Transcript_27850/g.90562  ORF Transcript_27850/g.90562 Transcript_27850/m.90562 type:complete len:246 (-) Transcript_27850:190-927(-)